MKKKGDMVSGTVVKWMLLLVLAGVMMWIIYTFIIGKLVGGGIGPLTDVTVNQSINSSKLIGQL
ncbi:MAG: hypothetical protein ABH879_09345 [archaeon]